MRHQVFFFVLTIFFSLHSMNREEIIFNREEVEQLCDNYITHITQFSQYVNVEEIRKNIEKIKIKYIQGSSFDVIANQILKNPLPVLINNKVFLLEERNEPTKRDH